MAYNILKGAIVNTTLPAFLAYVNTTISSVTGDGTQYTIIYDTEVFDQGSNFNLATSVFTAPVTGKYIFQVGTAIQGTGTLTNVISRLVSSNRTYRVGMSFSNGFTTLSSCYSSILIDMDAADTLTVTVVSSDTSGKVDNVLGATGGEIRTWLSGSLVC